MEFPKMLYKGGELEGETVIVESQEEQDVQKANGFLPLGERPDKSSKADK